VDGVDADAAPGELERCRPGEATDGPRAGDVRRVVRVASHARRGGDVVDRSARCAAAVRGAAVLMPATAR
jgi:hypothetical protein